VLYGEIAYVPLDLILISGGLNLGPRTVWILGVTFIIICLFIAFGYKGLFLTTFNEEFAAAVGISTAFWHYSLMSAVSLTTVVSFESVGAILVVAFLIVPPATAYLLTEELPKMLGITLLIGIVSSIGGYFLAVQIDGSIAGAITVITGIIFFLALLFAPKQGILTKRYRQRTERKVVKVH
jgi:manganese/zinc/iron transport system permease protein